MCEPLLCETLIVGPPMRGANGSLTGDTKETRMANVLRVLVFALIELVMAPFQLLALIGYTFKVWRYNIPKGISGTAYEPLFSRMLMHEAGTRQDEAAVRLAAHLPALSPAIAALFGSLGLASRWSGYYGPVFAFPAARPSTFSSMVAHRTDFFDRVLAEATDPDAKHPVQQVVVLGAGWDSRAYGSLEDARLRLFEVDTPPTQEAKRTALARAGLSADHVTFVETDFNQKSWFQAATEQGFDPKLPTFILWEGVTMYLNDEAVEATLRQVAQFAPGSRIAFDFFSRELVRAEAPFEKLGKRVKSALKFYGEHFLYGISTHAPARDHVHRLLTSQGLDLAEYEPLGEERAPKAPHGGLALAVRHG